MPVAWFLAPYARVLPNNPLPSRQCVMNEYTPQITADGGRWSVTEVLGNWGICKVNALQATLDAIAADARIRRLPKAALNLTLSDLNAGQKATLLSWITDMGYSVAEIRAALGTDIGTHTLGDVLRFCATRRLEARYDSATDAIILDGPEQTCKSIESVDAEV